MIEEVETGNVSTIIVKDMSRLVVRLIAINDNIDTERGENDFAPMMNIFNEWFVRSKSKKIRAVWQAKGKSGERLAVIPPYGYRKDENDTKQLVIDEESAAIVRRIFRLNVEGHGHGPAQIARTLNVEHMLTPSAYKYEHVIMQKARLCKDPHFWNTTTVHKMRGFFKSSNLTAFTRLCPASISIAVSFRRTIIGTMIPFVFMLATISSSRSPSYNRKGCPTNGINLLMAIELSRFLKPSVVQNQNQVV